MPEGDTLFRTARTLHAALAGDLVTKFESAYAHIDQKSDQKSQDHPIPGRVVERVEARGKHVLIFFSGDLVLRSHMKMSGSWHLYRHGERWQRPKAQARVVLETERFVVVGFAVPVAELMRSDALAHQRELQRLGPDLLSSDFDEYEALRRLRAQGERPIAQALLDQGVVAGIGNIFKSETLFVAGVHPSAPVSALTDADLQRILSTARRLMAANVLPSSKEGITTYARQRRTTHASEPAAGFWVYYRGGRPCRNCGAILESEKQGLDARITFWCPRCQPLPPALPPS
ncbi:MAG: DNA-formamidopyrimidine glycosylase family protein [Acidobacteriota bacterium]